MSVKICLQQSSSLGNSKISRPREEKRKLTEKEMYDIADFIKINPEKDWETSIAVAENIRNDIFKQLSEIEIYPSKIPKLKQLIQKHYYQSQIEPGQAVGVDDALAIGEPTTQLSEHKDEKVIVKSGKKIINTTIGEFIDSIIDESPLIYLDDDDKSSTVVQCEQFKCQWEIMSVGEKEKLNWCKITEVSRHAPRGNLVKVSTASGRENISTLSHSFLKRTKKGKIVPVKGSELKINDRIPVCRRTPQFSNPITEIDGPKGKLKLTKEFGEFLGIFIAEGSTCKSSSQVGISSKHEYYQQVATCVFNYCSDNKVNINKSEKKILGSKKKYIGYDTTVSC